MWMEQLDNGKYKYSERYKDPLSHKVKKVSITLNSKSNQAKKQATISLQEKIDKILNEVSNTKVTFLELLNQWSEFYPKTVKKRTFEGYRYPLKIVRKTFKDDLLIQNVKPAMITNFINEMYYKDDYSLNYVRMTRNLIVSIFDYAVNMQYLETNPAKNIKIKKKPTQLEDVENLSEKYLEKDELIKIVDRQANSLYGKRNSMLTEFISLTGLRFGEAVSLRYEDFTGETVYVRATIDYMTQKSSEAYLTTPKTKKSIRKVDLPDRAIHIVNTLITENKISSSDSSYNERNFIFTTKTGNPIMISNFNLSLKKAAKISNVEKNVTSHILRHTHISMLSELGLPIKAIMDRVGHENADTTLKIYTHVTEKTKLDVLKRLNESCPFPAPFQ